MNLLLIVWGWRVFSALLFLGAGFVHHELKGILQERREFQSDARLYKTIRAMFVVAALFFLIGSFWLGS